MADLATSQRRFMARVLDRGDEDPRWNIYRSNRFAARARAMEMIFPRTLAIVGQACFTASVREYVARTPRAVASLDHEGRGFEEVWRVIVSSRDAFEGMAYLPDLVRFERAVHDALQAPLDAPYDWLSVQEQPADRVLAASPEVSASLRILCTEWPLLELYEDGPRCAHEGYLWAHRQGERIAYGAMPEALATVMLSSMEGATMGELEASGVAPEVFGELIARGWIVGLRFPDASART